MRSYGNILKPSSLHNQTINSYQLYHLHQATSKPNMTPHSQPFNNSNWSNTAIPIPQTRVPGHVPMTARPYFGSKSSTVCPPKMATLASAHFSWPRDHNVFPQRKPGETWRNMSESKHHWNLSNISSGTCSTILDVSWVNIERQLWCAVSLSSGSVLNGAMTCYDAIFAHGLHPFEDCSIGSIKYAAAIYM